MKIINEKGKLFGIINLVDLIVLVLIVALVGFGSYKILKKSPTVQVNSTAVGVMMINIPELRQVSVDAIQEGDIVKDYDKNRDYGKIVKKEIIQSTRIVPTADGRLVETVVPGKYDVNIYIEGAAVVTNSTILMANNEVKVGFSLKVKGRKFAVTGIVHEINIKE